MTDDKTDVPCPIRTLAVRSDGTIVRGLAATGTEARRWLEAVQTHGRRTALAQVALAATTPGTPGEGHKGTTVSARNWRVVTDWTTPGPETYDPRGLEETPPGSRTVIIDQQGELHELTATADPAPDSNPRTFLEYLVVCLLNKLTLDVRGVSTVRAGIAVRRPVRPHASNRKVISGTHH